MNHSDVKLDTRFIQFLVEFNKTRDYFFCHDLLEEIWIKNRDEFGCLKYLLQIAVMQYKKSNHNEKGFQVFLKRSFDRFSTYENDIKLLGLNPTQIQTSLQQISNQDELFEFEFEILDEELLHLYEQAKPQTPYRHSK